jgi:hypothetical protein
MTPVDEDELLQLTTALRLLNERVCLGQQAEPLCSGTAETNEAWRCAAEGLLALSTCLLDNICQLSGWDSSAVLSAVAEEALDKLELQRLLA